MSIKNGMRPVHAGEVLGPESVWASIRALPVTRIGHGVRSADDPALMAELARADVVLLCPPHTPETENMANADFFAAMAPGAPALCPEAPAVMTALGASGTTVSS